MTLELKNTILEDVYSLAITSWVTSDWFCYTWVLTQSKDSWSDTDTASIRNQSQENSEEIILCDLPNINSVHDVYFVP